jgi:arsenate reductase (thioredoxin)
MEAAGPVYNVLFLCTGNSARSVLAEAALSRLGPPRFRAFSAGSQPKDAPHPTTLKVLDRLGYDTRVFRSKSWHEFARDGSPIIDFVFTVCGSAANETCPIWPGQPMTAHWAVQDPAAFVGSPDEKTAIFDRIYGELLAKIEALVALDPAAYSTDALSRLLQEIGER